METERVLMTHRLADKHYEAVGDAYAAKELPGVVLKGERGD
jgi:hypothetical protein